MDAIEREKLVTTAVLSGNRNFEGRIHPNVRAAYLASPALGGGLCPGRVADASTSRREPPRRPTPEGHPVYLAGHLAARLHEIAAAIEGAYARDLFIDAVCRAV